MAIGADMAEVFTFFSIGIPLSVSKKGPGYAAGSGAHPWVAAALPEGVAGAGPSGSWQVRRNGGGGRFPLLAPSLMMLPRPSPDKQTECDSPKEHRAGASKASTAWGLRNVASNLERWWASRETPQCDQSSPPQDGSIGNKPNGLGFNANCCFLLQEEINEPLWASDFSSLKLE